MSKYHAFGKHTSLFDMAQRMLFCSSSMHRKMRYCDGPSHFINIHACLSQHDMRCFVPLKPLFHVVDIPNSDCTSSMQDVVQHANFRDNFWALQVCVPEQTMLMNFDVHWIRQLILHCSWSAQDGVQNADWRDHLVKSNTTWALTSLLDMVDMPRSALRACTMKYDTPTEETTCTNSFSCPYSEKSSTPTRHFTVTGMWCAPAESSSETESVKEGWHKFLETIL